MIVFETLSALNGWIQLVVIDTYRQTHSNEHLPDKVIWRNWGSLSPCTQKSAQLKGNFKAERKGKQKQKVFLWKTYQ